ncbi:MAG: hypothetical protein IJB29_01175 [Mailhella sp.]|nr:hypothetical protein [Mailhella sp.]
MLFASHYGRRDFAIPGVHRVLIKPVRESSLLKRTVTEASQAYSAFLRLRDSGFSPDLILFSASSAIPLWLHRVFPKARLCGYADKPELPTDKTLSAAPEEEAQASMLRFSALAHCHAIFAFSEACRRGLPPLMANFARVLPPFIDTEFFSAEAAKPFPCAGRLFPLDGELISMDVRPCQGEGTLGPRAVWKLALGLLAHRPRCTVLLNCASPILKEASADFAGRLPESWQKRLAVQGYSSLDGWRDLLSASALFVLPEPCCSAGGVMQPEALEALSCGASVASPAQNIREAGLLAPALLELSPDSPEKDLLRIGQHLDIIRHGPDLKTKLRAHVEERYSPKRCLPSHMEELRALCGEHAFEAPDKAHVSCEACQ